MIISTTPTLEGRPVREYLGIVTGEVIVGANIFRNKDAPRFITGMWVS